MPPYSVVSQQRHQNKSLSISSTHLFFVLALNPPPTFQFGNSTLESEKMTSNPLSSKAAPAPKNHFIFDPWNSASSGHQRAESNPGTAWQRTREAKLAQQFRSGDCTIESFGYNDVTRQYGVNKGEWVWDYGGKGGGNQNGAGAGKGGRIGQGQGQDSKQRDIRSMMKAQKSPLATVPVQDGKIAKDTSLPVPAQPYEQEQEPLPDLTPGAFSGIDITPTNITTEIPPQAIPSQPIMKESKILNGTTIYINGQTTPLISDHKLKTLLVSHGAALSLGLSRRVTHVIIGKPNQGPGRGGAGGGLAAGKIQKEISRGGWRGIRIVGVEWALESIKAGKRLPETRFAVNLSSQRSVLGYM
ncbi:hypothetical protein BDV18DRAFT_163142 [Aspergillus unguis]